MIEGADRVAGAHRLAEGDEVGGDAGSGEAPEGGADPPEASLDLVGEEQGAGAVGAVDQAGDEVGGGVEDAFAGEAEVGQDEGGLVAVVRETGGGRGHPFGRGLAVDAAGAAAGRGEGGDVAGAVAGGPFVGAQVGHPLGRSVVGVLGDDGGVAAGVGGGHPPGELVGLGARGGEQARVQWRRAWSRAAARRARRCRRCRYREWVLSTRSWRLTAWVTVGWACPTTATLL